MALLGVGGLAGSAAGSASASYGSGSGNGEQPWYDWEADVDAHGHGLENLHSVDVEHVHTAARDADVITEWILGDGDYCLVGQQLERIPCDLTELRGTRPSANYEESV